LIIVLKKVTRGIGFFCDTDKDCISLSVIIFQIWSSHHFHPDELLDIHFTDENIIPSKI